MAQIGVTTWTSEQHYPLLFITTVNKNYTSSSSTYPYLYLNGTSLGSTQAGWMWSGNVSTNFWVLCDINAGDVLSVPSDCVLYVRTTAAFAL